MSPPVPHPGVETVAAIDLGTTGVKGVVLARSGELLAEYEVGLETRRSEGGRVEQDPEDWWEALEKLCHAWAGAGVGLGSLRALVLSGQMQDVVLTRSGEAVGPALLYADTRAEAEALEVAAILGLDPAEATGNPHGAASVLPKLLWLKRHAPRMLEGRSRLHVGAKDVLIERLCGVHVTDHTTAATTGLYDLGGGRWWSGWCGALGLDLALPELRWPQEVAGRVSEGAAAWLRLPPGLPVLTGLGDAGATTLGAGVSRAGERYAYLGTTGWLGAVTPLSPVGPEVFRLPLLARGEVLAVAPLTNAGSAHRWAAETFAGGDFAELERLVEGGAPASVVCLPYLAGERSPVTDPLARGVFLGIGPQTRAADLARAVLEGVAYALRATGGSLGAAPGSEPLTLLGGGTLSPAWCQIVAEVFGTEVLVPARAALLPVLGAAFLAFRHLGWVSSFGEYRGRVLEGQGGARYTPDTGRIERYEAQYGRFQRLYPAVRGLF